jgi:hypothetical protein
VTHFKFDELGLLYKFHYVLENQKENDDVKDQKTQDTERNSRRDFLKRAGKLAAYTPPAMLVLMKPSQNAFARSGGISRGNLPAGLQNQGLTCSSSDLPLGIGKNFCGD